jgi:hypothetical protein
MIVILALITDLLALEIRLAILFAIPLSRCAQCRMPERGFPFVQKPSKYNDRREPVGREGTAAA